MTNKEHLNILKQGAEAWNRWRKENPEIQPDLSGAYLSGVNLSGVNLRGADLRGANLHKVNLSGANFHKADLSRACLFRVCLNEAHLSEAYLIAANLSEVNLYKANLSGVNLLGANVTAANLVGADIGNATIGRTTFGDINLSAVEGLETVRHIGPSTIGIDIIYRSRGNIPKVFLRGAGIPEDFITSMASLVGQVIQFYSCFISHSSKDQAFAEQLHADLQNKGVRCWLASEDMKIGDKMRVRIDESIRMHDKLLLVLSEHSIASDWVEQEVETALAKEREQRRTVLFPIRVDDAVMRIKSGWPALIRNTRHIGDFREWKEYDAYQKAFARLLRDLEAENAWF